MDKGKETKSINTECEFRLKLGFRFKSSLHKIDINVKYFKY